MASRSKFYMKEDDELLEGHYPILDPVDPAAELLSSSEFVEWFSGSMILTRDGHPLMVFHGTAREDRAFRVERHVDMEGAYFTDEFLFAKDCAYRDSEVEAEQPYVISAFLRMRNPKLLYDGDSHTVSTEMRKSLESQGYDGVLGVTRSGEIFEYVVFHPDQIAPYHDGVIELPNSPVPRKRTHSKILDESPSP